MPRSQNWENQSRKAPWRMTLRTSTIFVCLLNATACIFLAFASFMSGSDQATKGLDEAAGYTVIGLFLITSIPALALAFFGRAPKTALILALAFPAAFVALFVAAIVAFA